MEIKQTLKEYKCAVFFMGFAASIPLIIFLATLMGDRCQAPERTSDVLVRCGHFFTNWIYDFQGLITGFSALIAALITIYTMYRNTRDMIYVEWKTTVFKIDFVNRQLIDLTRILGNFITNRIPKTANEPDWIGYTYAIYIKMMNLESILNDALEAGLSIYSLGNVRGDKVIIADLVLKYKEIYETLTNPGSLTEEKIKIIKHQNDLTLVTFRQLQNSTILQFNTFLKNVHIVNPHNRKFDMEHGE